LPFKDKSVRARARALWEENNRAKIRAQTNARQKTFWTKHKRPKRIFDREENRRRIRELKVLGIHMLIINGSKREPGFTVVPKLVQSAGACVDCGITKQLMLLDRVEIPIPAIALRFPFMPLNEPITQRADIREAKEAKFKFRHCEHLRFDDIAVARGLAYDYRFQCHCDFTTKRRLTLKSFQVDIAFCRDCWSRHAADNFNFDYCPPCMVKLLDSTKDFARLPLHSQWAGEGDCKFCAQSIEEIHSNIRNRAFEEWAEVQREVRAFKFAIEANKTPLEKDWSLESEFEKFKARKELGI